MIYLLNNIKKQGVRPRNYLTLVLFFIMGTFLIPTAANATHIAGGELTYRCIASWTFEVTLKLRRDCDTGSPEAQFDDLASVGIYDSSGELLWWLGQGGQLSMPFQGLDTLESELEPGCDFIGEPSCIQTTVYRDTITLPFRPGGYVLAYQRCCRNETLENITDPIETGSEYLVRITNTAAIYCNDAPTFDLEPELYICNNEEFSFDFSATESDGDSLVYRLCTPGDGADLDNPMPQPPRGDIFGLVNYAEGFSELDPFGNGLLSINSTNGQLTGTPSQEGDYLIGVCVDEYRDGELISSVKRDFEFRVVQCIPAPEASFTVENDPQCDGLEVAFTNTSLESDAFQWIFDYPNDNPDFISNDENPIFTFPADGFYAVKLIATRTADGCTDEFIDTIGVFDSMIEANFELNTLECVGDSSLVVLTNTSVEPNPNFDIVDAFWSITLGDSLFTASGNEVTLTVPITDSLEVNLLVTSSNGCTADTTKFVDSSPLKATFDFEILSCEGETTDVLFTNTSEDPLSQFSIVDYAWTITGPDGFSFNSSIEEFIVNVPRVDSLLVCLMVTSSNGCTADTCVFVDTDPVELEFVSDSLVLCPGDTSLLIANPNPDWIYTWDPEEGLIFNTDNMSNPSYTLLDGVDEVVYSVTVTDTRCSKEGSIVIRRNFDLPPDPFDFTATLDCGTFTVCFENTSIAEFDDYIFDFGDPNSENDISTDREVCYTYPDFGTYNASLTYVGGCTDTVIIKEVFVVPDLTISVPEDSIVFCTGDSLGLNIESDQSDLTAQWFDESGNILAEGTEVTIPGLSGDNLITVIAANAGGCMDTATVFASEFIFDLSFDLPPVACVGEDTPIGVINNTDDNLSYIWEPVSGVVGPNDEANIIINITEDTEFTFTATSVEFGCVFTEIISIPVSTVSADILFDPEEVYQCNPTEVSLADPDPSYTYTWNTGNTTSSFTSDTLLESTTFSVTVTDEFGCTATDTKTVTVLLPNCDDTDVFLPTAFSPNNDGVNDVLRVESNFIKEMELVIYNRWGEEVFRSRNQDEGWDGTFEGNELAPDVYVYALQVTCSNGETYAKQGNITLIR